MLEELKDGETKKYDVQCLPNRLLPNQEPSYCLGKTLEKTNKQTGVS